MDGNDSGASFNFQLDHPAPDVVVLRVHDDIDFASAPALRTAIAAQLTIGRKQLIIDLEGVAFLDTAGLAVLVEARHARPDLQIVCTSPLPRRTLEISGLLGWFHGPSSAPAPPTMPPDDRLGPA